MRLRYTAPAAAELDEVLTFIESHSQAGALRVKRRLQTILALLLRHPNAGQKTRHPGMRRVVVTFYRVVGDEIVIHSVRHGARKPKH